VLLFYPVYWVAYLQMTNNLISQATTMVTYGIPNDVMGNFEAISFSILIPTFDRLIFPQLRRAGWPLRPILRIALGFLCGALAMAYSPLSSTLSTRLAQTLTTR